MNTSYVLSFSAQDKPGIVELLSNTISSNGGNWLESAMSHLAGRFVGIVVVDVAEESAGALVEATAGLSSQGITISFEVIEDEVQEETEYLALDIELTGHDRPGIVRDISSALARQGANIEDLSTELVSGSMSAELLFKADIHVSVKSNADLDDLQEALEAIAEDLMVDININN